MPARRARPARRCTSCCARLHSRELSLVEVETPTASPFASSLLFDYVATYMYEGDTPNAERRAAALSLDRDLLRELLGQEELRELIDPGALEQVEADLQHRSERTRADTADALHDVLRRVGDLTGDEAADARRCPAATPAALARAARGRAPRGRRCASAASSAGSPPRTPACTATRSAPCRPAGLPEAFLADVPDALERLVRRYARTHGPFTTRELRERYGVDLDAACSSGLERGGRARARRAAARRHASASGATPRCCAACAAPRSPRCARRSSRPTSARWRASCRAGRASTATRPAAPGVDRLREVLVPLQGLALPAEVWERDVLPRRVGAYSPTWLDQLCASRRGRLGRRRRARPQQRAAWRSTSARTPRLLGPPPGAAEPPAEPEHERDPRAPARRRRASSPTCSSTSPARRPRSSRRRCGTSCGRAR